MDINNIVNDLIAKHGTTDPYKIADAENITVQYLDLSEEFRGVFLDIENKRFIIMNSNKRNHDQELFYFCHELGHAIMHTKQGKIYNEKDSVRGLFEEQAHEFARIMTSYTTASTTIA